MRLGLFGGTFDPIHLGHLILAEQCREACGLDRVWFVVAGIAAAQARRPHAGRPPPGDGPDRHRRAPELRGLRPGGQAARPALQRRDAGDWCTASVPTTSSSS